MGAVTQYCWMENIWQRLENEMFKLRLQKNDTRVEWIEGPLENSFTSVRKINRTYGKGNVSETDTLAKAKKKIEIILRKIRYKNKIK